MEENTTVSSPPSTGAPPQVDLGRPPSPSLLDGDEPAAASVAQTAPVPEGKKELPVPSLRLLPTVTLGAANNEAPRLAASESSSASRPPASATLRGFWRKTVDQTANHAQALWKQGVATASEATTTPSAKQTPQQRVTPLSSSASSNARNRSTNAAMKSPLIQATMLEQAELSPSNNGTTGNGEDKDDEKKGEDPSVDPANDDGKTTAAAKDEAGAPAWLNNPKSASERREGNNNEEENEGGDDYDDDDEEEDEEEGEEGEETASYVSSSAYSTSYVSSDAANKFSALQWAAASVVDSVQSGYFRGRYAASSSPFSGKSSKGAAASAAAAAGGGIGARNRMMNLMMSDPASSPAASLLLGRKGSANGGSSPSSTADGPSGTYAERGNNQATRILGSSHAQHMREMLMRLGPHEYIMFLGRGMLGVNLKQSYLQKIGVYVDYLIPNGAAERSGLIRVGDLLRRVGDVAVDKQTILTIPQQIAKASRPLHLVWATGTMPAVEALDHVEIVLSHMQRWRNDEDEEDDGSDVPVIALGGGEQARHDPTSSTGSAASISPPGSPTRSHAKESLTVADLEIVPPENQHHRRHSSLPVVVEGEEEEKKNDLPFAADDPGPGMDESFSKTRTDAHDHPEVVIPSLSSIEDFCSPRIPSLDIQEAYHPFSACRNQGFSVMQLCQSAATDNNFRSALQHAFVLCAVDDRRLPFLSRHLSQQEEEDDRPYNSPSALLMLFVEMVGFADLYDVTPETRRIQIANRLAHKFFLPTRLGHELLPPMFDFHQIVPDSTLRALEANLKSGAVHRDSFGDFCSAAMESLSSHPFVTFLVSADCARMRAYLRNTSVFVNVPLHRIFDAVTSETLDPNAQNYFCYMLLYVINQTDREGYGEYDEQLSTGNGARCKDSAGGLCAAIFIRRKLVPAVRNAQDDEEARGRALKCWERLWEIFLAPHVGALSLASLSNEAASDLSTLVSELNRIRTACQDFDSLVSRLCEEELLMSTVMLADELIYSYASTVHAKFREHKFHEWLCKEFADARKQDAEAQTDAFLSRIPRLPEGCIKRLLRRVTYPIGVAPHKPFVQIESEEGEEAMLAARVEQVNAECAVVFGSRVGLFDTNSVLMGDSSDPIRRYACEVLYERTHASSELSLEDIPPTLESYAVIPSTYEASSRPFQRYRDGKWLSTDGWDVALVNLRIPRGDSSDGSQGAALYGVALVFRSLGSAIELPGGSSELLYDPKFDPLKDQQVTIASSEDNYHVTTVRTDVCVDTPNFNKRLKEESWSERVSKESWQSSTIGLVLLSKRNVVLAMRDSLSHLVRAFMSGSNNTCGSLVNILGSFSHEDVESVAIHAMLSPFLKRAASPWLERPISSQRKEFEQLAGRHLLLSLPPVPLALMFVTAMLEQKIVIASSRRSILFSASVALSKMLRPLGWCHLFVPRVPASLAADLMQYPAPFIIGIPSEDPGMMDLIRDLPEDVTLVDLDIGRVILAQSFSHVEFGRGTPNNPKTMRALRSQLLYLAQVLGGVFGGVSEPEVWSCDRPSPISEGVTSSFDRVCEVCRDFLTELLAGTASCSYWIEEASDASPAATQEPTVVFDEDRFFHIKSMRHRHGFKPLYDPERKSSRASLAVSLSDFELVVEVLMQCQSMNAYIASCDKDTMVFAR